jgi:cathepsin L
MQGLHIRSVAILALHLLCSAWASDSYEDFRTNHGGADLLNEYGLTYEARQQLFRRRKAEAMLHNARNASWKMVVNRFSDYTDSELQAMLGYKRVAGRWSSQSVPGASSFIQQHEYDMEDNDDQLASEVDWRQNLQKSSTWIRDQGKCGSCWAVAAVGALEMHAERKFGSASRLSHQQLVDCVPNPRHCGGTGGCKGATGELAFEFARIHGVSTDEAYQSKEGGCNKKTHVAYKLNGFVRLPENKASYLKHAIATQGPVVVSADGGKWFAYGGGVFSGCAKDTVVNHAILGVGYGIDPVSAKDYWTIRNSWGPDWGENGFMRIERHMNDNDYAGIDDAPKEGVFCDDAPATVPISGMCGITSDSAYPSIALPRSFSHHRSMVGVL